MQWVYNDRARIYGYQGQIELARQEIQKGLTLDPTQRLLRTSLGYLDFRQGDYTNAIATLESVLHEDSSLRLVYPTLALCYLAAGKRAEAAAMITEGTLSSADADGEMALPAGDILCARRGCYRGSALAAQGDLSGQRELPVVCEQSRVGQAAEQ